MEEIEYYDTDDLADKLKYKGGREAFLKALKYNHKFNRGDSRLSAIWNNRERIGRRFLFKKDVINKILGSK
jgi:hypothetical protein